MAEPRLASLIAELQRLCDDHPYQAPDDRERAYNSGYTHGVNRAIAAVKRAVPPEADEAS